MVCFCAQGGGTALFAAAQEGKMDVLRLLVKAGAQLNMQTKVKMYITDVLFTSRRYT